MALGLLGALMANAVGRAQERPPDHSVEATYLYKMAAFVEWPPSTFPAPSSSLNLSILGADPFGATLDQTVSGQRVDDHPTLLRRFKAISPTRRCHTPHLTALPTTS